MERRSMRVMKGEIFGREKRFEGTDGER